MYTLHKPRPTNEFVGVDGLYSVDGVFERMNDSQHIPWPWSKFAVRAVKSEHIKGSWMGGVDKCVQGIQPWFPNLCLVPCSSFHASVVLAIRANFNEIDWRQDVGRVWRALRTPIRWRPRYYRTGFLRCLALVCHVWTYLYTSQYGQMKSMVTWRHANVHKVSQIILWLVDPFLGNARNTRTQQ
jgi:hypothetical protein